MIRRTRNEWLQLIEDHKQSNLTATEFCKNKGIDPKYFSLKKSKLQSSESASSFVQALTPVATGPELSLSWGDTDINLPANTSPIWLAQFVRELAK